MEFHGKLNRIKTGFQIDQSFFHDRIIPESNSKNQIGKNGILS